jgi:hypothetical protein
MNKLIFVLSLFLSLLGLVNTSHAMCGDWRYYSSFTKAHNRVLQIRQEIAFHCSTLEDIESQDTCLRKMVRVRLISKDDSNHCPANVDRFYVELEGIILNEGDQSDPRVG